jgi:hypothetical protein
MINVVSGIGRQPLCSVSHADTLPDQRELSVTTLIKTAHVTPDVHRRSDQRSLAPTTALAEFHMACANFAFSEQAALPWD